MIQKKYLDSLCKIEPTPLAMDFSEIALEQALIQLKFDLSEQVEYILHIGRDYIDDILKLKHGYNIFNIKVEIQEDLKEEWYLVKNKTIVYSPGA